MSEHTPGLPLLPQRLETLAALHPAPERDQVIPLITEIGATNRRYYAPLLELRL